MAHGQTWLLVATRNRGKLRELSRLLDGSPFPLVSLDDVSIGDLVAETGATLEENATLKATEYARLTSLPTLADDSALEVAALRGQPGARSARFAGEQATDAENIALLLEKLIGVPDEALAASFRCVIATAWPQRPVTLFSGECRGRIVRTPRGANGFGYDPVFFVPELGQTMAELTQEQKDSISHRGIAARKALQWLNRVATDKERP
ncbi:MAG: RdgB/HAM1 family non-canonical purine NTP pyrophosphatase [SAR202 cluster bacterium]|nr:RdgB/HAM1 family non-canonical purine NTP pyrophosphatase [SAR202 cluster bacterium]